MHNKKTIISNIGAGFQLSLLYKILKLLLGIILLLGIFGCANLKALLSQEKWVGTWSTAPQLVEPHNNPPEPGLTNNTLRQIVCVSIGGDKLRMKLSNEFSKSAVEMNSVKIAVSEGGIAIDDSTVKTLKFGGEETVTIPAGTAIYSDAIEFKLEPRMKIAITIAFGKTPSDITGHPGSRTTSFLISGNKNSDDPDFSDAIHTDHWYVINGIEVKTPKSPGAVVVLGNSITDGRGSGTNKQNRWPDILAQRLLKDSISRNTRNIGVLNMGIGGNAVLKGGLGPTALERFERDVLGQRGVRWLIIMEGVNDLGATRDSIQANQVAYDLIAAYETMIKKAHKKGIKVYGGTITPIKKSFYYKDYREDARQLVNNWIRNSGKFDAVIDFDQAIRNPKEPLTILPEAQSGDYLHPNELGYELMGKAIDLDLFNN